MRRGLVSEREERGLVGETWIIGMAPPGEGFGKERKFEKTTRTPQPRPKPAACEKCGLRALGRQCAKTVGLGFTKATTFNRNSFFHQFSRRVFECPLPPQRINCRVHQKLQKEGRNNSTHHGSRNALHDF